MENTTEPQVPAQDPSLPLVCVSHEGDALHLRLGTDPTAGWIQGSMRIKQPLFVVHEYARRMLGGLMWMPAGGTPDGLAVHLGLGAGTLARFTRHALAMPTVAVDVNPHVIEACRLYFHVAADERMQVVQADGRAWLRDQCPKAGVRLLFVDMYDREVRNPVFDDAGFYRECRDALRNDGIAAFNLVGAESDHAATLARMAEVFGTQQLWVFPVTPEGHTIVLAGRQLAWPAPDIRLQKARAVDRRFHILGLKAGSWPRLLGNLAQTRAAAATPPAAPPAA